MIEWWMNGNSKEERRIVARWGLAIKEYKRKSKNTEKDKGRS